MATTKHDEKIAALEKQLAQARESKKMKAKRDAAMESKEARTRVENMKYLIGAMVMKRMDESEASKKEILAEMDKFLTKPRDRALFSLPELAELPALKLAA